MKHFFMMLGAILATLTLQATPMKSVESNLSAAPEAVARPFYGWVNGKFIVAGGSSFIDGQKTYSNTISVYDAGTNTWEKLDKKLPVGVAEGGCATIDIGTELKKDIRLLCFGGVTVEGVTAKTFLLNEKGEITNLPDCPHGALSMTAGVAWEKGVAFVGGKLNGVPTNKVLTLTPKKIEGSNMIEWKWGE